MFIRRKERTLSLTILNIQDETIVVHVYTVPGTY